MRKFSSYQSRVVKPALLVTLLASFLTACDNDKFTGDPAPQLEAIASSSSTQELEVVAKSLAKSLADHPMRAFIKQEASKRTDGDYNILYTAVSKRLIEGKTLTQVLATAQSSDKSARTRPVESIIQEQPLLNISVPVNIKKWDASNYVPLVAVLTNDDTAPLKAFDKDGNVRWLDAKQVPSFPVVVIGQSERFTVSATGKIEMKKGLLPLKNPNDNGSIALMNSEFDELPDDSGGGGGGGDNPGSENPNPPVNTNDCSDMSKLNITLTGWYSGNLSAIESWARGAPEIRMRATGIDQNRTKVDVYGDPARGNLWKPNSRDDVNGRWWNLSDYLFYWNVNYYGEEVNFILHEEDGGSPRDISIPVSFKKNGLEVSTTITFRVDDGDDYIGHFPRRLPFCSGSTIGNETLKFRVTRN